MRHNCARSTREKELLVSRRQLSTYPYAYLPFRSPPPQLHIRRNPRDLIAPIRSQAHAIGELHIHSRLLQRERNAAIAIGASEPNGLRLDDRGALLVLEHCGEELGGDALRLSTSTASRPDHAVVASSWQDCCAPSRQLGCRFFLPKEKPRTKAGLRTPGIRRGE